MNMTTAAVTSLPLLQQHHGAAGDLLYHEHEPEASNHQLYLVID